ncbi:MULTISPECIES: pilus assembly protein PilP [unclassified Marinobacter]|uniref:pilus assembly protein PilP n=1 Tax=unclassified Marinobacter TaxID=83889 RepID=UPI00071D8911|nr:MULTISPECIES: pilus assembly protein PilP [unclassified Marinobacter]KRW81818.1 pilus assembly protein PilP [Marinobacter sp. P4B1]MCE0758739.1 pilus assembly protein PilP [Marinobacter sp. G11]
MTGKHAGKAWLGVCLASLLTACSQGNGFSDLDKFMADTRAKPRGHVEPLPEFKAYEAFSYSAADRRAPFEPPIDVQLTMAEEQPVSDVEPDLDRPKEVLENFDLKSLGMVGTLQGVDGSLFALIRDNEGGIHRVRTGNYMGQNYGRVVGVSDTRIELVEIVPNGRGGWVERPRSLSLDEG